MKQVGHFIIHCRCQGWEGGVAGVGRGFEASNTVLENICWGQRWLWRRRLVVQDDRLFFPPQHNKALNLQPLPTYQKVEWVSYEALSSSERGLKEGAQSRRREERWHGGMSALSWGRVGWDDAMMYRDHAKILTVAKTREHMYIPLEWIEDIYAIAYYSIIRNATAHMHRKCF